MAAWAGFLRAHSALTTKLERDLVAERGLPLAWFEVLLHIERAGYPLRMQELGGAVLLSKSGLTRLVDRMAGAGLVERVSCSTDRRGVQVAVTAAGKDALAAARPVHLRGVAEYFSNRLDHDDLQALSVILGKLLADDPAASAEACDELDAAAEATSAR
jgi:DNA-binding MarR family transcriptional regulator